MKTQKKKKNPPRTHIRNQQALIFVCRKFLFFFKFKITDPEFTYRAAMEKQT